MRFVDVHCHLLPGLDDGPPSIAETLAMLRLAHAGGTRVMVATPHCFLPPYGNSDPVVLANSFRRLTEHLEGLRAEDTGGEFRFLGDMALYLGAENYVSPEFLEALAKGAVVPLNDSRYLLIEFPPYLAFEAALSTVERILQAGFFPVLAHVERYSFFHKGTKRLAGLVRMGCVAQVNASTVLGSSGRGLARVADRLLDRGLVQILASDGHGTQARSPDLGRVAEALGRKHPAERVALWLWENAAHLLENKPPVRWGSRRGIVRR